MIHKEHLNYLYKLSNYEIYFFEKVLFHFIQQNREAEANLALNGSVNFLTVGP